MPATNRPTPLPSTVRLRRAAGTLLETFKPKGDLPPTALRLAESEQRYQAVIENASDMIQSVRPDGTFEFVNKAWKDALRYTDDDLAEITVFAIVHPDYLQHCMGDFMRAISGETVDFLETRFLSKDGRTVPVEGSITSRLLGDEVVATHGFFRDITERLRARKLEERAAQLERAERARYLEKMAALGKLSAGLAHELNNPAAAVQRANSGLRETLQRRDAAMRQLAGVCLDSASWRVMEEILGKAKPHRPDPLALSETEATIETWLEDHGIGRSWELAPALAEAGITARELTALAGQLPATSLPDAVSWLAETLVFRESTEIIGQSSRRIAELVQSIKGYSHMDRATEHDGDIHDGLENTVIILAHQLGNVDVHRDYDRSLPAIRMYGNTLNQVWTNILDNAVDAVDGKGQITIRTRSEDDQVVVEIEDNGKGISADVLPRIFEPFYTSKPQGKGTGLGLDTAWRIVTEEHDGTIAATSEPGRTVFTVNLPVSPPPGQEESPA
ncbi:MAG: Two-component system sensor histidine kinase [uncultured Thermomicrobiales bacterium]|uniref:histidine kinase n=1 Tax=uncultured Thermomicrobiales bacterium TaxID=1645740 RepID=A0A6J4UIJ9_9BACT|nr:MAG: Two-component system sensor histidine kinase [uncultured Thermomicrobiales bacterium]